MGIFFSPAADPLRVLFTFFVDDCEAEDVSSKLKGAGRDSAKARMSDASGAGTSEPDSKLLQITIRNRTSGFNVPFNDSSSKRRSSTEDGASSNSAKVKFLTLRSETLRSRRGG